MHQAVQHPYTWNRSYITVSHMTGRQIEIDTRRIHGQYTTGVEEARKGINTTMSSIEILFTTMIPKSWDAL